MPKEIKKKSTRFYSSSAHTHVVGAVTEFEVEGRPGLYRFTTEHNSEKPGAINFTHELFLKGEMGKDFEVANFPDGDGIKFTPVKDVVGDFFNPAELYHSKDLPKKIEELVKGLHEQKLTKVLEQMAA